MSESINNTKLIESLQNQIVFLQQTVNELRQRVQRLENNTKVPNPYPKPLFPFPLSSTFSNNDSNFRKI